MAAGIKKTNEEWYQQFPDLEPGQNIPNSKTKVYFRCPKGHRFFMHTGNRMSGRGCRQCSGRLTEAQLHEKYPDLISGQKDMKSSTPVLFNCSTHGVYKMRLADRSRGHRCQKCSGLYRRTDEEWYKLLPDLAKGQRGIRASKKVRFVCPKGHASFATPNDRTSKQSLGCPMCSGHDYTKRKDEDWYREFPDLEPGQTNLKTNTLAKFICNNGHSFSTKLITRMQSKGNGCSICSNVAVLSNEEWYQRQPNLEADQPSLRAGKRAKFLCPKGHHYTRQLRIQPVACEICKQEERTSKYYNLLPNLEPGQANLKYKNRYWFKCSKAHRYQTSLAAACMGCECPKCSGRDIGGDEVWYKRLPDLELGQTNLKSHTRGWFICENNHRFDMKLSNRKSGFGCPFCSGLRVEIRQPNPIAYVPAVLLGVTPNPLFLYGFTDPALLQARIALATSI